VTRRRLGALVVAASALLPASCEQPPTRELDAAQAQVDAARKEGAEQYAADRWRDAQASMQTARDRVAAKDYRGALSAANAAADRARAAIQAIRAARTLARGRTETAQAEVRAVLEEVDTIRQEAAAARIPDEAFSQMAPRVEEVKNDLQRVTQTLQTDALKAQTEAAELKAKAADLPTAFRQAQAKWEAEHRQARRRAPKRRR
jgi:hypothetical protein